MDISQMLVGKSDQLDNVDLISGPRDFTITAVSGREGDQPLNISLAEYDRPWRPGLTVRRILAALWGTEAEDYVGRRVRLYRDPDVKFGTDKTGGTRISHASHIDKAVTVSLPTSKGKFGAFTVQPLPTDSLPAPTGPTAEDVAATDDLDQLSAMWKAASPTVRKLIEQHVADIKAEQGTLA